MKLEKDENVSLFFFTNPKLIAFHCNLFFIEMKCFAERERREHRAIIKSIEYEFLINFVFHFRSIYIRA